MTGTARVSDFLHLHANVSRRVRNLETGVHPTSGEGYVDSVGPIVISPVLYPFTLYMAGTAQVIAPQWQRRFGIVSLLGGVEPAVSWSTLDDETLACTLPPDARPLTELMFNGAMRSPPYVGGIRVQTDGQIWLLNPHPTSYDREGVRFDGATWTIN